MKNPRLVLLNALLFAFLGIVYAVFQSSLWFLILKDKISPPLWILGLSYLTLYRPPLQGLLWTYAYGLCLYVMTVAPFSHLLLLLLTVFTFIQIIKKYFFQTGGAYFLLIVGCTSLFYEVFYLIFSLIIHKDMVFHHRFFSFFSSSLYQYPRLPAILQDDGLYR